jgi:hypothetical protein
MASAISRFVRPFGKSFFAAFSIAFSDCLRSATTPISVGKLRPISWGSISMWMSFVEGMLNV